MKATRLHVVHVVHVTSESEEVGGDDAEGSRPASPLRATITGSLAWKIGIGRDCFMFFFFFLNI